MYRDDSQALKERVQQLEQELAGARAQLEAAHISLKARDDKALELQKELDKEQARRRWRKKAPFETWLGAVILGFLGGIGLVFLLFLVSMSDGAGP